MMRWILKIKIYYITNHKFCKYIFLGMEFNSCDKMIKKFSSHPIIKLWGILNEAKN